MPTINEKHTEAQEQGKVWACPVCFTQVLLHCWHEGDSVDSVLMDPKEQESKRTDWLKEQIQELELELAFLRQELKDPSSSLDEDLDKWKSMMRNWPSDGWDGAADVIAAHDHKVRELERQMDAVDPSWRDRTGDERPRTSLIGWS